MSAEAPKDDGSGMIDRVPGYESPAQPPASREQGWGELTSTSSGNMRSPVVGLPPGMTTEQAHVLAREQYDAARAAAEANQAPEQQQ